MTDDEEIPRKYRVILAVIFVYVIMAPASLFAFLGIIKLILG